MTGHGDLRWGHAAWAAVPPAVYGAYGIGRGSFDGWYACWFLDPTMLSLGKFAANIIVIVAAFVAVALILVAVSRAIDRFRPGRQSGFR